MTRTYKGMDMRAVNRGAPAQSGFTLIEVLVTLLILAVGLLGLAGLQTRMLATELESYQRSHALVLVQDMVNRVNANRAEARNGSYSGATVYGTDTSHVCSTASVVGADLCQWNEALQGAGAADADGAEVGAMIGARGCIETVSGSANSEVILRVTVVWQGMSPTVAPSLTCGEGAYGDDDRMRRAVSMLVTLAYLGV
ncbi:type IV pilus modification protein PilV [Pseudomonas sp. MAP12]|uniref:Type IV pilus modification protein PilV n=1 Tax=Geopseudomonas aromaticivorans TaxID=2849492 RepID=A0ABS6MYB0_9GAMM|nr:type IV pilus modification protein PilV [Pseudomonas aromaticivorans]MBV2133793.1 type IV pilus modification protein PilV [Pseudomonas aromaticivorans]